MLTCQHCHAPLPDNAQFCPRCGAYVPARSVSGEQSPEQQPAFNYYTQATTTKGSQMFPAVVNSAPYRAQPQRRRRTAGGCALGCLTVLIVFLLILGAGWVFIGRPYIHDIAARQLNSALDSAVNVVPSTPLIKLIPSGTTIPINEGVINSLITQNLSSSSPVQSPTTKITTQNVTFSFTVYNFPCSISMVPAVSNGHLVARNVQINGIIGLVMSPEEMSDILNTHFSDAQNKLGRTLTSVQLTDQAINLTLG
jgi:hypothetical protein